MSCFLYLLLSTALLTCSLDGTARLHRLPVARFHGDGGCSFLGSPARSGFALSRIRGCLPSQVTTGLCAACSSAQLPPGQAIAVRWAHCLVRPPPGPAHRRRQWRGCGRLTAFRAHCGRRPLRATVETRVRPHGAGRARTHVAHRRADPVLVISTQTSSGAPDPEQARPSTRASAAWSALCTRRTPRWLRPRAPASCIAIASSAWPRATRSTCTASAWRRHRDTMTLPGLLRPRLLRPRARLVLQAAARRRVPCGVVAPGGPGSGYLYLRACQRARLGCPPRVQSGCRCGQRCPPRRVCCAGGLAAPASAP